MQYTGVFTPRHARAVFLGLIDQVQVQGANPADVLLYLFCNLIKKRDESNVDLAKPHSLSIYAIMDLLSSHFSASYTNVTGTSRLPVLAVYAAYQCMMKQVMRCKGKILCPLEKLHSADLQTGRLGDIDVNYPDNTAFEGVEIKHGIVITRGHTTCAYEKFKAHKTDRYYLLTTASM